MKIRMVAQRTGGRYDNRAWPPPGGEFDVPDEEGAALCAAGDATPVAQKDADVETRGAESKSEPAETPTVSKPAANAPKADWQAYAIAQGTPEAEAAAATKNDLIARHG